MVEYVPTFWIFPMLAVLAILSFGAAYWVYRDAKRHGSERAGAWGLGMVLLGPVAPLVFVSYLLARRNLEGPHAPPTRFDRLVRNVVVASLLTFVVAAPFTPPDPFTQAYYAAVALPIVFVLAVLYTYRDVLASAA